MLITVRSLLLFICSISSIFDVTALTCREWKLVFIALSLSLLTQSKLAAAAVNRCPMMLTWDMTKIRFGNKVILYGICWINLPWVRDPFFSMSCFGKEKQNDHPTVYGWDCVCQMINASRRNLKILSSSSHPDVLRTRPHWITSSPAPSFQSHGEWEALAPLLTMLASVQIWVCQYAQK